jgi:hypothetical protein
LKTSGFPGWFQSSFTRCQNLLGGRVCPPRCLIWVCVIILSACNFNPVSLPSVSSLAADRRTEAGHQPGQTLQTSSLPPPQVHTETVSAAIADDSKSLDQYILSAQLDYESHTLQVKQSVFSKNPSIKPLSDLVMAVEASRMNGVFNLRSIQWENQQPLGAYALENGILRIQLQKPLQPGERFGLELDYEIKISASSSFLGYTGRQLNLGDWYPFFPAYREGTGWLVHDPSAVGEHLVYPVLDFQLELNLAPAARPLILAASAPGVVLDGGRKYRYELKSGRGFALSISPDYKVLSARSGEVEVRAYVFPEHELAGQASIQTVVDAIKLFSSLYAPYPYSSLAVVEGELFDGMEYSGLFFLGSDYFGSYPGRPTSYLVPLSAHETAHQWWYGLVGDDPAFEPWLDESLSTYSELLYYQKFHPEWVDWWWEYRVNRFAPQGKIDISIYAAPQFRPYVNAVYLQGVRFLDSLRSRIGEDAFRAFLQDYARSNSGKLASRTSFFEAVNRHSSQNLSDLIALYFLK